MWLTILILSLFPWSLSVLMCTGLISGWKVTLKYQILLIMIKIHAILSDMFSQWEIGFNATKLGSIYPQACEMSNFLAFLRVCFHKLTDESWWQWQFYSMQYFVSCSHCLGPTEYNIKHIYFVNLYCSKVTQVFLTQTSLSKYSTSGSLTDLTSSYTKQLTIPYICHAFIY